MADFYLKSGAGAVERANDAVKALGDKIVIARGDTTANYLVVRKWVLECTTAGTTGAAVPAWPAAPVAGDTLADGTATWTFRKPGFSTGTTASWAFSAIYMDYVALAMAAGDRLYVSNNHAESIAAVSTSGLSGTLPLPSQVVCGTDTAAPPTAVATTGTVTTTGANNITVHGSGYVYGLTFNGGSGAVNASVSLNPYVTTANAKQIYKQCSFKVVGTGTGAKIFVNGSAGANNNTNVTEWHNCSVSFASAAHQIKNFGTFVWDGGSVLAGSTALTSSIFGGSVGVGRYSGSKISAVDLTEMGAACSLFGAGVGPNYGVIRNCKLPAAWTGELTSGTLAVGERYEMHNCDNADTNYRLWVEDYYGSIKSETAIVKTSGASDGTTALAWKMTTSANSSYPSGALASGEIHSEWIEAVGAAKTITVEIIHDSLTALNNDEVWLEIMHLGTAGFPLGVHAHNSKADVLAAAAAQPASTVAWTTTGLTNPNKQKLSVTFTPQEKGVVVLVVKLAKASYTVYVDPLATIS